MAYETTEPFPQIYEPVFRPEIHEPVAAGSAREAHYPPHKRAHLQKSLKSLGLGVFETGQLVEDKHIPLPFTAVFFYQPGDNIPVDHIQISFLVQGIAPFAGCSNRNGVAQSLQVTPLCQLIRPDLGHADRADNKDTPNFKPIAQQLLNRCQRNDGLPTTAVQEDGGLRMLDDEVRGISLIPM